MKKRYFDLQIFANGSGDGDGTGSARNGSGGQENDGGSGNRATYSYEQAEQIAEARADRATKAALADYFKRQGMSEEEVTAAIADYRTKKGCQSAQCSGIRKAVE